MPGLDGVEVARQLRQVVPPPEVILVTAYEWNESGPRPETEGIVAVLHKPVSPSTLHDALLRAVGIGERPRRDPQAPGFPSGLEVLLVEDHPLNRELVREFLTQAGLGVSEAHDGGEALALLRTQRFDAVLMDVQMPGMDGVTAVREIRAQPDLAHLPVIALTAHAMLGDKERFLAAGMSDYVAKPVEEEVLRQALARWLPVAGAIPAVAPVRAAPPASTSLPAALPGLDVTAGLRRASGNADLYRRLAAGFGAEVGGLVARMQTLLADGDEAEVLRVAHTLKGTAATLGATRLAAQAAEAEASVRGGTRPSLVPLAEAAAEIEASCRSLALPPPAPTAAVPPRDVLPLVRRLAAQVAASSFAATSSFAELKAQLDPGSAPDLHAPLVDLEACLDRLDFEAARAPLATLDAALSRAAGAAP
jgi:CheY-like chemotaxis protein/HPt (histidine-containing phosphotransfer) domain-containing protein